MKTAGVASLAPASLTFLTPTTAFGTAANSAVTVGVIGPGRRGAYDAAIIAKNPAARVVALADLYDDMIAEAKQKIPVPNPRVYQDYRALLASDVDAVMIATPPYKHPEQFEVAVQAKKHIFLEKPTGVDVAGCQRVMAAARKADPSKDIAVGFQQRYGPGYNEAYRRLKEGKVGEIKMARACWLVGDLPRRTGNFSPEEEKIRNWLFYREYSGDIIVEQNVHSLDVVNWYLGTHPLRAIGWGGRLVRTDIGNIQDHFSVIYEYPGGIMLSHAANQFSKGLFGRVTEEFICTNGAIETSRRKVTIYDATEASWTMEAKVEISVNMLDQFIARIQSGKVENVGVSAAQSTLTGILGRTAIYENREVKWEEVLMA
jgi:myo-inositol 2-dehydrogenase/D-chiro-inositol 1-dehydrogenase